MRWHLRRECPGMFIIGVDLAWGERNRDGLCLIAATRHAVAVREVGHTLVDGALLACVVERIVKYKRGPVASRRREFRRLQKLLRRCLVEKFPWLRTKSDMEQLLRAPWSKPVEDQLDAFFCALIGYHHHLHRGQRSEILG